MFPQPRQSFAGETIPILLDGAPLTTARQSGERGIHDTDTEGAVYSILYVGVLYRLRKANATWRARVFERSSSSILFQGRHCIG